MKVLHVLASNQFSGAENVACQIIHMFKNEIDMAYCSPQGNIAQKLQENNMTYFPLQKLNTKNLNKILQTYQPNVIHAHDIKAVIFAIKASKGKVPVIGHVHGNDFAMRKFSLKSVLFQLHAKKCKHIFWVSNSCLKEYKFYNKIKDKSSVLYNIVNVQNIQNSVLNADKKYDIIYLGRLTYPKNPLRLLEIAKDLANVKPNFTMAVVGDGVLRPEFEEKLAEYHLQNNVKMLGFVSNPYQILAQSKVMLMSSIYEGTPMCALEAISLGVPIVSTPTDGMKDIIRNDIGVLYQTNQEAVSALSHYIMLHKNEYKQVQDNINKFSEEYNNISTYKSKVLCQYATSNK